MARNRVAYSGVIDLNDTDIDCYVLQDGKRILSSREMQRALKMVDDYDEGKQTAGTRLTRYLNQKSLKEFIFNGKEQDHFDPIVCYKGDQKINGYEAHILIDLCDGFLQARKEIPLSTRQKIIADQCEILVRSFAKVGLIALIDEATGYQYEREKDELQKILTKYISAELLPWQKRFPDEYYREIFRLNGWGDFIKGNIDIKKRPGVIGTWTNKLIYEKLPKGVLEKLKEQTPKSQGGNYTARFHQSLSLEVGEPHLEKHLASVITLMRVSDNWEDFIYLFNKAYGQLPLFDTRTYSEPVSKNEDDQKLGEFDEKLVKALNYNPKTKG